MYLRELVSAPRPRPAPFGLINSITLVRGNRNADGTYSPTSRWENGIAYEITTDGLYAQTHDACDYTADGGVEIGNAPGSPGSANTVYSADYAPFVIEATDGCRTSMGYTPEERKSRAADALELMTQKAVEREFWNNGWTGVNSATNRSLVTAADTVTLLGGTPQKPRRAIAALEQALADHGAGTLGSVHVTRDALSMLKLDVGNDPNSDTMYTPGGNLLIGGVGYPGTGPNGEARTTGNVWAYACGPVQVRLSPVKVSDEPSKITGPAGVESFSTNNTLVYTAERFAAVTFNGNRVYAVLMNLDG